MEIAKQCKGCMKAGPGATKNIPWTTRTSDILNAFITRAHRLSNLHYRHHRRHRPRYAVSNHFHRVRPSSTLVFFYSSFNVPSCNFEVNRAGYRETREISIGRIERATQNACKLRERRGCRAPRCS